MPECTLVSPSRLRSARTKKSFTSLNGDMDGTTESFWGIELSQDNPEEVWSVKVDPEEEDDDQGPDRDFMIHQLYVKMATLGKGVAKGEENIVEVQTLDKDGKLIRIPIINMIAGVTNTLQVNADFTDKHKVTFHLMAGSGPVYLSGSCLQEYPPEIVDSQDESLFTETETTATDENGDSEDVEGEEDDMDDDDDEEEEEEEEEEEMEGRKGKGKGGVKRKTASPVSKGAKAKKSKLDSKADSEDTSGEDDEDEYDDEEMDSGLKKKKGRATASPKSAAKGPKVKAARKGAAAVKVDKRKKKVKGK